MPNCFIVMPITTPDNALAAYRGDTEHFRHVLDVLFAPAVAEIGYALWPPSAKGSDLIHDQIVKQLETADLVLCDMSALNANVFFELGIRTALDKPVSLVKDDVTTSIPFDAAVLNYYTYSAALNAWSLKDDVSKLATHLKESVSGSKGRNAMWRRFGLTIRAGLPTEQDPDPRDAKLDLLIDETSALSRAVADLAGSPRRETRMGVFIADALKLVNPSDLRRVAIEPQGDYVVNVVSPNIPVSVQETLTDLGRHHGIKVNLRWIESL
jgi:hypothetical protein